MDRHAETREAKRRKAVHGMRVSGRSLKSVILPLLGKPAKPKKGKR